MVRTERWRFTNEMKACCLSDLEPLRNEALSRLGPSSKSLEEQRNWDDMIFPLKNTFFHWLEPSDVAAYAPYLNMFGRQLIAKPQ